MKDLLAELYRAAAEDIDSRDHSNAAFLAGPQALGALREAAWDLVTLPLAEGVRSHLGLGHLREWRADKDTVIKTLRGLAGTDVQLDQLQDSSAEQRIATATRILRDAFGWPAVDHKPLETIADDAAQELRVLRAENKRLREALTRRNDTETTEE